MAKLTERDREILGELIWAYDHRAKLGWHEYMGVVWDGVTPLDCGGSNGSDHSYRLTKLVKLGLAEHRKGATWGRSSTRIRGSKKYRPTAAGRDILASESAQTEPAGQRIEALKGRSNG